MQWKVFKSFIGKVVSEGNRLQKVDINGQITTKKYFTQTQKVGVFFSIIVVVLLRKGFSENFAGFVISFLSIYIGLFTSIVINLFDKSKGIIVSIKEEEAKIVNGTADLILLAKLKKGRNYLIQFTGLSAYAILLATLVVILLLMVLLFPNLAIDIYGYKFVNWRNLTIESILTFLAQLVIVLHRYFILYLLFNFFVITIYSISSYFNFISSEYKLDN